MSQSLTSARPSPQMLLITGTPATGKTRLARALCERLDAMLIAKDEIKELLFEQLGGADAAWSRRLSNASFALQFSLASKYLQRGPRLLLEGNFRPGEHEPVLQALLQASGAQAGQVLCHASAATREQRLLQRAHAPDRHAGHADVRLARQPQSQTDFLQLPGPRWRFDSDAGWNEEFARLLPAVQQWLTLSQP